MVNELQEEDLKLISNAIESGKCLAFLGAGASTTFRVDDSREEPGLPTGGELAKWLAEQCEYTNGTVYDLPKVAEYYLYTKSGDRELLEKAIQEKIQIGCKPRPIHTVIAQLSQIKIVITSNYDSILENELNNYGRNLTKHVYDPQNPKTGRFQRSVFFDDTEIILHKMHGSIDEPRSMVITQSDYIRYLTYLNDVDRGMPEYFRKTIIPQFTLLFLGYSLEDWNFRVIWEGVLSNQANLNLNKEAYALVKNPSHFQTRYWARRNVVVLDEDLTDFARKLAEHFNLEIPQLGIEKKREATINEIFQAIQIKWPEKNRVLIGDVWARRLKLEVILQNTKKLQGAAVSLNNKKMSLTTIGAQKFLTRAVPFSSNDEKVDVAIHAVAEDGIGVSRDFTFEIKKLRRTPNITLSDEQAKNMISRFNFYIRTNPDSPGFTNNYKYTVGAELRDLSREVLRLMRQANNVQNKVPLLLQTASGWKI